MAYDILSLSPTYLASIDEKTRKQQQAIVAPLRDDYTSGRERDGEVLAAAEKTLANEGLTLTEPHYRRVKELYRGLWLWYSATDEAERAKSRAQVRVLKMLKKDGLTSWSIICERAGLSVPPTRVSDMVTPTAAPASRVSAVELRRVVASSTASAALGSMVRDLFTSLEAMIEENERLKAQVLGVADELTGLRHRADDAEELLRLFEATNTCLEEQIRIAQQGFHRARIASLADIAAEYPHIPELAEALKKISRVPTTREVIIARLPREFTWGTDRDRIIYERPFLDALLDFSADEQNQVVKQIEHLAMYGPEYGALHTRKKAFRIPFSPEGAFTSRGAEGTRFSWKKNGALTLHWLYRKGNSLVRESEA
jgi:hypothetical protein